jgi:outer membrane protein OmpA-like peptidoglycan-associated protein
MAVERFLVRNGVDAERIVIEALGGTEPRVPGSDPVAFARNRRVELIWR